MTIRLNEKYFEDGDEIPAPTLLEKIEISEGAFVTFVKVDAEEYLQKEIARKSSLEKSVSVA